MPHPRLQSGPGPAQRPRWGGGRLWLGAAWLTAASAVLAATPTTPAAPASSLSPVAAPVAAAQPGPVRVVCIAEQAAALQTEARRLQRSTQAAGGRHILEVGTGFLVDPDHQHVLTSWSAATACAGPGLQPGIAEPVGAELFVTAGQRLPDRTFQDASGQPVKLVQAICRDAAQPCGADLPRAPGEAALAEPERRRQLDNLLAYAPDLAVLRLLAPSRTPALGLAPADQLDDQARLQLRFTAGDQAAVYTGPHQMEWAPQGTEGAVVRARWHRLTLASGPLPAGRAGAPLLRGSGVVGVLSALHAAPGEDGKPAPVAFAVPVTVAVAFLDLLKVPHTAAHADPLQPDVAAQPTPQLPAVRPWHQDPPTLMVLGAAVLALLAVAAFVVLWRRNARQAETATLAVPTAMPYASRTVTRVNRTLLHAVAAPTSALSGGGRGARLVGLHGALTGLPFTLPARDGSPSMQAGRSAQHCQLVLPPDAEQVSGQHALFQWDAQAQQLSVTDHSSNGTWVNGLRVVAGVPVTLASGDSVALGGPDGPAFRVDIDLRPAP